MKFCLVTFIWGLLAFQAFDQSEMVTSPSNGTITFLEKNVLSYADESFTVSQSGGVSLDLKRLLDGSMAPHYTPPLDPQTPYVLLIENLPDFHSQCGVWIGWSARYFQLKNLRSRHTINGIQDG